MRVITDGSQKIKHNMISLQFVLQRSGGAVPLITMKAVMWVKTFHRS